MGFVFTKLKSGKIVSSSDGLAFRKLSTVALRENRLDLTSLNLPAGTYVITVSAFSSEYGESEQSNPVLYTVK